ncbi:MAG TPA: hypothetical protein VER03_18100 [Bryobacteraceae bacterium]|nr:hypothetical protein [Bryobacteraceae bacterium]
MSSAAKALANRANATHSTGPNDTSKTRFNGVTHGLTSKQPVIPGENQAEYDTFAAALRQDLRACTAVEKLLADRVIAAAWRLKRFTRVETAFFTGRIDAHLADNPDGDPDTALANLFSDPAQMARMRLFLRYQNSVQKEYDTAMRELLKAKKERAENSLELAWADSLEERRPSTESAPKQPTNTELGFASQVPGQAPQSTPNAAAQAAP